MHMAFGLKRPLANYPTRATIQYTSFFDQTTGGTWSPFTFRTENDEKILFGNLAVSAAGGKTGGKHAAATTNTPTTSGSPLKVVGDNTLVVSMNGGGASSITMNGQDATDFFDRRSKGIEDLKPSPMLLNGLSLYNEMTQFPHNKGDWFSIHAFKVEQLRPPLEASSEAAVDLTVTGSAPVTVTIEVVDAQNNSRGYVLRDATVSPGKYRLYWDGIDQKGLKPEDTAWIGAGSYTFRLTTGLTAVHYAGEINNSAPKYTTQSYMMVNCNALAMTPPGTTVHMGAEPPKWKALNNPNDTRKWDTTDSVQTLGTAYGAELGQWICADGTLIHPRVGDNLMQNGRALAMTPPDPSDPTNSEKQFYFVSQNIKGGNAVISGCFPVEASEIMAMEKAGEDRSHPKILTSPDWNRTKPGFIPYQIRIGQVPGGATLGPQHQLFFEMDHGGAKGDQSRAEWVFRNVRLYEEGSPDPGPTTFDPSKFAARGDIKSTRVANPAAPLTSISETAPPAAPARAQKNAQVAPIPPGTITVEDNGHAVHFNNAPSVNYPMDYTITDKTIMAFDLDVIDQTKAGSHNGIGLSPDASAANNEDSPRYFHFLGGASSHDPRSGFNEPSIGAYSYPAYQPNTLYTDAVPLPPADSGNRYAEGEAKFLWQPGFYGLKISEDGKFLFVCNNADGRLEVRDISTDGHAVAKIPIDYPMFVTLAPDGAAGARQGTRYVYVDSPNAGLLRIAWNLSDNTFSKPETITAASGIFLLARGIVYNAAAGRIFVCDTFNINRSKEANQIVVIDPKSGTILSRFGKKGGVNPNTGGQLDDETFTCPLTIDADSKGALWVNDYYSCEMRKYDFDPASNGFKVERRVLGANMTNTSHFFWLPDAPPTQVWTLADFFVRNDADLDADGRFTNPRTTSAMYQVTERRGRPYPHFCKVGDHLYATFSDENTINERVGDGWVPRFAFGGASPILRSGGGDVEDLARKAGLLAKPGEPPTDLDKAIAASGDPDWKTRPWAWSDLNGDGKMEYTADNPELKIDFNAKFSLDGRLPSTCFRSSDGAFICPCNDRKGGGSEALLVVSPQTANGKVFYDLKDAKMIPCTPGTEIKDVLAQDGRFYVMRSTRELGNVGSLECYDESGKLLWTRQHDVVCLVNLQSLGDGMFTVMDRGFTLLSPVQIRTKDGDLVNEVSCRDVGDCWGNGALRSDADTGYIGIVQAYKVTGLSTVKSAAATVDLPRAGQ